MLRLLTLLIGITIPSLIYFDMVDSVLMIIIGVYYSFILLVNLLGVIVLGGFSWSTDNVFKDTIQERLKLEMGDDVNYHYRISALLIFEMFALYMICQLTLIVGAILMVLMLFQVINMCLVKYVMEAEIGVSDDADN